LRLHAGIVPRKQEAGNASTAATHRHGRLGKALDSFGCEAVFRQREGALANLDSILARLEAAPRYFMWKFWAMMLM
jgi:hypothetical protein